MADDIIVETTQGLSSLCTRIIHEFQTAPDKPDKAVNAVTAAADLLAEHGREAAQTWLDVGSEVARPVIRFYARRSGSVAEIMMDTLDDSDPETMMHLAASYATLITLAGVDGYFVTSEAWVATAGLDDAVNALSPCERMDRREVVVVAAANRTEHVVRMFPIERDLDGRASVGKREPGDTDKAIHFSNPIFSNLFLGLEGDA
jgi:hypothetical protein